MPLAPESPEVARIDAALAMWRQGDLALDEGAVRTLGDMTAREYIDSDRLDFDHLSTRPD